MTRGASSEDVQRQLEANRLIIASLLADRRHLLAESIRQRVLTVIPHEVREVSFHRDADALFLDDAFEACLDRIDDVAFYLVDDLVRVSPADVFTRWGLHYDAAGRIIVKIPETVTSP